MVCGCLGEAEIGSVNAEDPFAISKRRSNVESHRRHSRRAHPPNDDLAQEPLADIVTSSLEAEITAPTHDEGYHSRVMADQWSTPPPNGHDIAGHGTKDPQHLPSAQQLTSQSPFEGWQPRARRG